MTEAIITEEQKIYAVTVHSTTDETLMGAYNYIESLEFEPSKETCLKVLCNEIRKIIKEENLIGLVTGTNNETNELELCMFVFPIKATEDNFVIMYLDEEKNNFYLKSNELE